MSEAPQTTQFSPNEDKNEDIGATKNNARKNGGRFLKNNEYAQVQFFLGDTPKLDAVLSIVSERPEKGVSFEKFQEKLKVYVLKNFHKGQDVIKLIMDLEDPLPDFESNNAPTDLPENETSTAKIELRKLRLKRYLDREELLTGNIVKLYGIIYGQCTPALKSTVKGDVEYAAKSSTFDTLWLLEKLKAITAGVDTKSNPALTLHEQILTFFTMHQGSTESDDNYLTKFSEKAKKFRTWRWRTYFL